MGPTTDGSLTKFLITRTAHGQSTAGRVRRTMSRSRGLERFGQRADPTLGRAGTRYGCSSFVHLTSTGASPKDISVQEAIAYIQGRDSSRWKRPAVVYAITGLDNVLAIPRTATTEVLEALFSRIRPEQFHATRKAKSTSSIRRKTEEKQADIRGNAGQNRHGVVEREPDGKGIANRSIAASCAGGGNIASEALTGAHAGQPLSSEITTSACRPCSRSDVGAPPARGAAPKNICLGTKRDITDIDGVCGSW